MPSNIDRVNRATVLSAASFFLSNYKNVAVKYYLHSSNFSQFVEKPQPPSPRIYREHLGAQSPTDLLVGGKGGGRTGRQLWDLFWLWRRDSVLTPPSPLKHQVVKHGTQCRIETQPHAGN
ncbi:hypothetical protein RRG08_058768 [Elysia crispata]|uniref:Uncharacterized protein n=1 Tax=Elysia crispata TaxID=231223 RepID=A0AAE0YWF6_9GAST|nr:hypothetical protein RRG08_058768 [Elysia crispata]